MLFEKKVSDYVEMIVGKDGKHYLKIDSLAAFIKENKKVEFYVRYMDDIILFSSNKRKIKRLCLDIEHKIIDLKMSLKQLVFWMI